MGKGEVARKNVHFNIKKLKELTVNAMAAIDAEYWNKCVSKVMKEVHQYMIYDGLIPEDVFEDDSTPESPLDADIPEDDIVPSTSSSLPSSSKENNEQLKKLIIKQCTEDLISPTKLADMHKKNEKTIRNWIKSSGAQLPPKYLEKAQRKISFASNYEEKSLLTANDATQRLTKQLILNLKSNWPSLSKTMDSQPNSSNGTNCETIFLEPDLEKKSTIDEKTFQCPKCSFKASMKHNLDKHLNNHNDCVYCGKVFLGNSAKRQLVSHLKTHQEKPKKQHICKFCNKDYKTSSNLTRHMKVCKKKPKDV